MKTYTPERETAEGIKPVFNEITTHGSVNVWVTVYTVKDQEFIAILRHNGREYNRYVGFNKQSMLLTGLTGGKTIEGVTTFDEAKKVVISELNRLIDDYLDGWYGKK